MKKFEVGKSYSMRSIGDHNCIWTYEVISRTAKTIKIKDEYGEVKTCRVKDFMNSEMVKPLGTYSMSPSLRA